MQEILDSLLASPWVWVIGGVLLMFGDKIPWATIGTTIWNVVKSFLSKSSPTTPTTPLSVSTSDAIAHYAALRTYLETIPNISSTNALQSLQGIWPHLEPKEVSL